MVSYTNLSREQCEEHEISAPKEMEDKCKVDKDMNSAEPPSATEIEPASVIGLSDRRHNRKLWLQPTRFSPMLVSTPVSEMHSNATEFEIGVRRLVEDLKSSSLETVREAAFQLRLLAKELDNRTLIGSSGAIIPLVELLKSTDPMTQEYAVTALLNLSINDNNKIAIANANAIEPLIHVLRTGTPEARENAAATLYSLSVFDDNKKRIGKSGAIGPLVDLLGNATPRGKKDAATALFNLSTCNENRLEIVKSGAVKHLIELMDPAHGLVDRAVVVLANLATLPEGRTAISQAEGIPLLVEAVELGSARAKENATAALVHLCSDKNRYCRTVLEEGAVPSLVILSKTGTPRGREKATRLLTILRNLQQNCARRG